MVDSVRGCVRGVALGLAAAFVGLAASSAHADFGIRVVNGDKRITAISDTTDTDEYLINLIEGSKLSLKVYGTKDSDIEPILSLRGPDGMDINIDGSLRRDDSFLRKFPIGEDGTYIISVDGNGTTGEYCLRVANTTPGFDATVADTVSAGNTGEYPFDLAENGSVTFEVRRTKGNFPLQPWLRRPDGSRDESFDDLVKRKRFGYAGKKIPVRGPLGEYTLVVPGPTDGSSSLKVSIRPGNSTNQGTKAYLPVAEPVIDASPNAIDVLNTDIGGLKPEEAKVGDSVELFGTNIGETARVFLFSDPDSLGQGGSGIGEGTFEFPTPNQIVDRIEVPSDRASPEGDTIVFTIPDIALGEYQVYLCNPEGQIAPAGPRIHIVEFAITNFTPTDGPASGFTEITVTGTGFEIGMTGYFIDEDGIETPVGYWVDTFGAETVVDGNIGPIAGETYMQGVIFDSTTQARFVTPNHAPGFVDFRMETPGAQDTFLVADAFEYLFRVDSILPADGPASGGTLVALVGEGFHPDMTAILVEDDGTRREVDLTVTDPQNASFTTPFHLDLVVDIEVQNPPFMFTDINGDLIVQQMDPLNNVDAFEFIFRLDDIVVTIDPTSGGPLANDEGPASGGSQITLTGEGFHPNMSGTFTDTSGNTFDLNDLGSFTVLNSQSATFLTPEHVADLMDLTIQNPVVEFTDPDDVLISRDSTAITVEDAFEYLFRVDSLTPSQGSAMGATVVALAGEGFHDSMTAKFVDDDGNQSLLTTLNVSDAQNATFTTDRHAAGFVALVLQNPDYAGNDPAGNPTTFVFPEHTTDNAYEFRFEIASLDVIQGPAAGGTLVEITGEGFDANMTCELVDGDGNRQVMTLSNFATGDGVNTVEFTTELHAKGFVDVVIQNPTWNALDSAGAPVILESTIRNLENSFEFRFEIGSLAVTFDPSTGGAIGSDDGPASGASEITLTGEGFDPSMVGEWVDSSGNRQVLDFTYVDATEMTFTTDRHAMGFVALTIQNPDWDGLEPGGAAMTFESPVETLNNAFEFLFLINSIEVTVDPTTGGPIGTDDGPASGNSQVTLLGNGFDPNMVGEWVDTLGNRQVLDFTYVSPTEMTFTTDRHDKGFVDLTIQNPDWDGLEPGGAAMSFASPVETLANAFEFLFGIDALSLDAGPAAGGTNITLTGEGFDPNMVGEWVDASGNRQVLSLTWVSEEEVTFTTDSHAEGFVELTIQNPDWDGLDSAGTPMTFTSSVDSLLNAFEYQFFITSIEDPTFDSDVPASGGTLITITGRGFHTGMSAQLVDSQGRFQNLTLTVTPGDPDVPSAVDTATFTTSNREPGYMRLDLQNPDWSGLTAAGTPMSFANPVEQFNNALQFQFLITSLDNVSGPAAGGQTVEITGEGFHAGITGRLVDFSGNSQNITLMNIAGDGTTAEFITSLHGEGIVDLRLDNPDWSGFDSNVQFQTFLNPELNAPNIYEFLFFITSMEVTSVDVPDYSGTTQGPASGGTEVTITGEGFHSGMDLIIIDVDGNYQDLTGSLAFNGTTEVTFTTPLHRKGLVDVEIQNPTWQANDPNGFLTNFDSTIETAFDAFEFIFYITDLVANEGVVLGGETITINGEGFAPGMTGTFIDKDLDEDTLAIVDDTNIAVTFDTPLHEHGFMDIALQNPSYPAFNSLGQLVMIDSPVEFASDVFEYLFRVDSLTPNSGPSSGLDTGGNPVSVTVDGAGFTILMRAWWRNAEGVESEIIYDTPLPGSTQFTFDIPPHSPGVQDLVLQNFIMGTFEPEPLGPELVFEDAFNYEFRIDFSSPASGPASGGTPVTIIGEGFATGMTGVFRDADGSDTVLDITVTDSQNASFTTPLHTRGFVDLVVKNPDFPYLDENGEDALLENTEAIREDAFEYEFFITSLDITSGPASGGTTVTVTGEGFDSNIVGSLLDVDGNATPLTITVTNSTTLSFVTPEHPRGFADLVLQNPDYEVILNGVTQDISSASEALPDAFEFIFRIDTLTPATGPASGGTPVTVTGEGFGLTVTAQFQDSSGNLVALDITRDSSTQLTFTTPAAGKGLVDLILTNSVGPSVTGEDLFEYLFEITSLDVVSGPASGDTLINVLGEGFDPAMTATFRDVDGIETALDITVADEQNFSFTTPPLSFGFVDLIISNPVGVPETAADAFEYILTVTTVSPVNGAEGGGTLVTVDGDGFADDVVVTLEDINGTTTVDVTVIDETQFTFTTQEHLPGVVDIVIRNPSQKSFTHVGDSIVGYEFLPSLKISGATPESQDEAGGTLVTVTGSAFAEFTLNLELRDSSLVRTVVAVTWVDANTATFTPGAFTVGDYDIIMWNDTEPEVIFLNGITFTNEDESRFFINTTATNIPASQSGDNFAGRRGSVMDLDGDGLSDIVLQSEEVQANGASLRVLHQNSDGTFSDDTSRSLPDRFGGSDTILDIGEGPGFAIGDIDDDDKPDVLITSPSFVADSRDFGASGYTTLSGVFGYDTEACGTFDTFDVFWNNHYSSTRVLKNDGNGNFYSSPYESGDRRMDAVGFYIEAADSSAADTRSFNAAPTQNLARTFDNTTTTNNTTDGGGNDVNITADTFIEIGSGFDSANSTSLSQMSTSIGNGVTVSVSITTSVLVDPGPPATFEEKVSEYTVVSVDAGNRSLELNRGLDRDVDDSSTVVATWTDTRVVQPGFEGTVAAQGTLTLGVLPVDANADTVTIGSTVYTFLDTPAAAGDVDIGADADGTLDNLVTALAGGDAFNTTAHSTVTAVNNGDGTMTLTALTLGSAGNSIVTTSTFFSGSNFFDAATLGTTRLGSGASGGDRFQGDAVELGDLDGDGDLDAVVSSLANVSELRCRTSAANSYGETFDYFATYVRSSTRLLINDGSGVFADQGNALLDTSAFALPDTRFADRNQGQDIAIVDINGDDLNDIIICDDQRFELTVVRDEDNDPSGTLEHRTGTRIFRNLGSNRFVDVTRSNMPTVDLVPVASDDFFAATRITMGDVDGDGDPDMVLSLPLDPDTTIAGTRPFTRILINRNNTGTGEPTGIFDDMTDTLMPTATAAEHWQAHDTALFDIDGDGDMDLILTDAEGSGGALDTATLSSTRVLVNDGTGKMEEPTELDRFIPTWAAGAEWFGHGILIGDVNNDGEDDVVIIHDDDTDTNALRVLQRK